MRIPKRTDRPQSTTAIRGVRQIRTSSGSIALLLAGTILLSLDTAAGEADRPEDALVAAWRFDREHVHDGKVRAVAGSTEGRVAGTLRLQADLDPQALVFDGAETSVLLADDLAPGDLPADALTVEAWVAIDTPLEWGGIASAIRDNGDDEKGWLLGYRGERFTFALASETTRKITYLSAPEPFRRSSWHHVVGTWDGETQAIFVDGHLAAEGKEQSGRILYAPRAFFEIGAYHDDDEYYRLEGAIASVAIFRRALSGAEILARWNEGAASFSAMESAGREPLAAWRFDAEHASGDRFRPIRGGADLLLLGPARFSDRATPASLLFEGPRAIAMTERGASVRKHLDGSFTVAVWVAVDRPQESSRIASSASADPRTGWILGTRGGHFAFGVAAGRELPRERERTWIESSRRIDSGRWYHVAAAFDPYRTRLFVDGRLEATSRDEPGLIRAGEESGRHIELGGAPDGAESAGFHGLIHSVGLWERAIDVGEAAKLHRETRDEFPRPFSVSVGPFVEHLGGERVEIRWRSREPSLSIVAWGRGEEISRRTVDAEVVRDHRVVLDDVRPNTVHSFQIRKPIDGRAAETSTALFRFDSSFDYSTPKMRGVARRESANSQDAEMAKLADQILAETGVRKGYCLVIGGEHGGLARELATRSDLRIVILEEDRAKVRIAREALDRAGLYGLRVSVHHGTLATVEYAEYLANLVVSESTLESGAPPARPEDVFRVLRPSGGTLWLAARGTAQAEVALREWSASGPLATAEIARRPANDALVLRFTRGPLDGAGEWTHQYGSADHSATSRDALVRGGLRVLWWGRPGPRPMPDRGARNPSPLYANGRLFVEGDRTLFGIDAYNGTILWTLQVPGVRRSNIPRDGSNIVAANDALYVADGPWCIGLDAASGARRSLFGVPDAESESSHDWGILLRVEDTIIGSAVKAGSAYRGDSGEWYDGTGKEDTAKVVSDWLFAIDRTSGRTLWTRKAGVVINSTVAAAGDRVWFVESRAASATSAESGRLREELGTEHWLVCLHRDRGEVFWERPADFSRGERMLYLAASDDTLAVVGSSDRYHIWTFDARYGDPLWSKDQPFERDHHGGAIQHPVLVGGGLYSARWMFDLRKGDILRTDLPERRGCGTMAASLHSFFYRHYHHGMWDTLSDRRTEFPGIRSGCWLGILPAGGVVLAPETSSGCYCTDAIQISVAYVPAPE